MTERERRIPAWLLGLLIAFVAFTIVVVVSSMLGIGDDPVVGTLSRSG